MRVHIPVSYFSILENLIENAKMDFFNGKAIALNSIYHLLNALPIYTDISDNDVKKIFKSIISNKQPISFKEQIIWRALKNQRLSNTIDFSDTSLFQNLSSFYFLAEKNADYLAKSNGIVCLGENFSADDFYTNCNVSDLKITNSWNEIKNNLPPTNAMLIIDPYIFTPDKKNPYEKIDSLVRFIETYKADISISFHLTIISEIGEDGISSDFLNKTFDKLKGIADCQIQICLNKKLPTSDRRFFTNYTSGNIGHPFDRDTVFNQNFLGVNTEFYKIRSDYRQYQSELEKWSLWYKNTPKNLGLIQCKWETSEFINRIFIS